MRYCGDRRALDVAGVAHRDRHVFVGDQVLDADVSGFALDDLGSPGVAVVLLHASQFVDDDLHEQSIAGQDGAQAFDLLQQLREFVEDLLPLEAGEALELHVENRLRLDLGQPEARHQAFTCFRNRLRSPNQRDDRIEVVEGDLQALEDVVSRFGLSQLELGPATDNLAPEVDEDLDEFENIEDLRAATNDGQHDDAEARLQRRVLVEIVQHDVRQFAALQLDDDAHAIAVGLVAKVGNALDHLLANQVRDALDQLGLVDLVRDLREDDRRPVALLAGLDFGAGAHEDRPATGRVRLHDAAAADDEAARREVRTGDDSNQLPQLVDARQLRRCLCDRQDKRSRSARCSRPALR